MPLSRTLVDAETGTRLDTVDSEEVHQLGVKHCLVRPGADGRTITAMLLDNLESEQNKIVKALLTYLRNEVGPGTAKKQGGTDGIDFDPERDKFEAEAAILSVVYNAQVTWSLAI
jgi:hypothetical protein